MTTIIQFETITLPTPFAVGPVNVYLIKGSPLTLIDAGPLTSEAEEILVEAFRKQGLRLEDLETIILTHAHPDHFGLASRLRDLSNAPVYLHETEKRKLDLGPKSFHEHRARIMREAGVPERALEEFENALVAVRKYVPQLDNTIGIRDGHVFRYADFSLRALHVAGHSSGQICLFEPREGLLFSGDQILGDITPNPMIEPSNKEATGRRKSLIEYLDSLKLLRELRISLVLPAHGGPIYDHVEAIDRLFEHHTQREEIIYNLLNDEGQTAYGLSAKLFSNLSGFDVLLGVSEVLAHLDILVAKGRAAFRRRQGHPSQNAASNHAGRGQNGMAYVYYRSAR